MGGFSLLLQLQSGAFLLLGIALFLVTVPLVLELLVVTTAAALPRRRPVKAEVQLSPVTHMVVLVPSHNEEATIRQCVESLATSTGGTSNILVIAHNCSDNTADRARDAGAVVTVLDDPLGRGKGHALVHGFELAFQQYGADAVLIVDADSRVSRNLIERVTQGLSEARVVQCRYESKAPSHNSKARLRALAFRCMNVVRPLGRTRMGLSCGIFGNGFALRREVLEKVPYEALSIVEDLEFHLSLISSGIRTVFIEDALVTADGPANMRGETIQTARWEGGRMRLFAARGASLMRQVVGGDTALIEPMIDLAGLPMGMALSALLLLLLLPIPALRAYAVFGLATIAFHLVVGIRLSPDPGGDIRSLAQAPYYVVTKIAMLPSVLRMARKNARWVRTSRASTSRLK